MISKKPLINLRIDNQLLDEIEKIAIEKFNENTSETIRFLIKLGLKFDALKPLEMNKEKIEEITNKMKQQVKNETFFEALNEFTPEQQGAIKRYIMLKEEERGKQ